MIRWSSGSGGALLVVFLARFSVDSCAGVPCVSGLLSADGGSPSLRFGFAIYPPLERGWFAAHVTPLSIFRENLLALGAPYLNVFVRCVVGICRRTKKTLFAKGAPGCDP